MARTAQKLRLLAGTALASYFAIPVAYASGNAPGKLTIMDLPIYDPLPAKEIYEFVPKEPNTLENGIGAVRVFFAEYKQALDNGIETVQHKWEVSKAHTMSLIDYIQNDPNILPRLGVITVAGLGGVVAGYRGGVARKVTYSAIGLTSATCLCYPNEVTGAAKSSAGTVVNQGKNVWNFTTGAVVNQSKNLWRTITAPSPVVPESPKPEEPKVPAPEEEVAPKVEAAVLEAPATPVPEPVLEAPAAPAPEPEPVLEAPAAPAPEPATEAAAPAAPTPEPAPAESAPAPALAPDTPIAQVAIEEPPPQAELEAQPEPPKDFGQSSKEDDDLYTTRG